LPNMQLIRRLQLQTNQVSIAIAAIVFVAAAPAQRQAIASAHVEVIRRDQLSVSSVDEGRTRVLYTSSLGEPGGVGYRDLGPLIVFAYDEVQPGSGFKLHSHENVEVITIVLEGSLDHEDTAGHKGRLKTGEVALMSAGVGVKHAEFGNPDVLTRSVTIWVKPRTMNKAPHRAIGKPVEKNGWQLIAAERDAPLIVEQDVRVLMKRLAAGKHVRLAARPGRMVYLAPVEGEVVVGDQRVAAPERAIVRAGEINIATNSGATVVAVDVPLRRETVEAPLNKIENIQQDSVIRGAVPEFLFHRDEPLVRVAIRGFTNIPN
jgi:redox-sensitive bicupin YhaK (pirin superfamily)